MLLGFENFCGKLYWGDVLSVRLSTKLASAKKKKNKN